MTNRRKPRNLRTFTDASAADRCECVHDSGPCSGVAQVWVTVPCSEEGCTCPAVDKLICLGCLATWQTAFPGRNFYVTAL